MPGPEMPSNTFIPSLPPPQGLGPQLNFDSNFPWENPAGQDFKSGAIFGWDSQKQKQKQTKQKQRRPIQSRLDQTVTKTLCFCCQDEVGDNFLKGDLLKKKRKRKSIQIDDKGSFRKNSNVKD